MNSNGFPNEKARKEHEDPWKADLFFVLVRIIKDPDVGFFRPEEFLCSFEGVACREIRIASVVEKDVFSPDNINRSGIFQNTINLFAGTADDDVSVVGVEKLHKLLQCHDARCIEVSSVFHAQNDDAQVFIERGFLNLCSE
jgi:hypothetical protein